MSAADWTDDRIVLLKLLWTQGLSGGQIAKRLKMTRCAVIAKAHRMKLPRRAPSRKSHRTGKASVAHVPARKRSALVAVARTEPFVSRALPARDPASLVQVRFGARSADQCAMFCDGEEGADGFVCGAPVIGLGAAWCAACVRLVYDTARTQRHDRRAA